MNVTYLTVELITGFFLLFLLVKVLGKKIIDQITPFTFIAAIVLSELLGNAVYDEKISLGYIVYAMSLWALLLFAIEILGQKSVRRKTIRINTKWGRRRWVICPNI